MMKEDDGAFILTIQFLWFIVIISYSYKHFKYFKLRILLLMYRAYCIMAKR